MTRRFAEALAATPVGPRLLPDQRHRRQRVEPKAGFAVAGTDPGASLTRYRSAILPLPPFREAARGLGFVSNRTRRRRHRPPTRR